ncbi:MAG: molybdopterin molybdotransferase MoeA [Bryobacter sp.]
MSNSANAIAYTFAEARERVLAQVPLGKPALERVWLSEAVGRVLGEAIRADRDMPPLPRSLRDGFVVHAQSRDGAWDIAGEIKAGQMPTRALAPGEAFAIMTGAIVPDNAAAVIMKEHVTREGSVVRANRAFQSREWISEAASMAQSGAVLAEAGALIDASLVALLATVGQSQVTVAQKPIVRILSTGDEVLDIARQPNPTQVRNSNAWALAAEVQRFGGAAEILPIAPDEEKATRELIAYGLGADLLLISGGVSAGDYDFVEIALAHLGAEFYFDRVKIQPGQPTVFGRAQDTFFFGLPGNPLSTWVTFRIFALAALERLSGRTVPSQQFSFAPAKEPIAHKPGLTRFLPGQRHPDGSVSLLPWQGSGDIPALARANVILVLDAERESWAAGDWLEVMTK